MNESKVFYILVKNATILSGHRRPRRSPPTSASRRTAASARVDGQRQIQLQANIADLGDLRTYGALRTIDGDADSSPRRCGTPSLQEGQEVDLPDWSKQPVGADHRARAAGGDRPDATARRSVASGVALRHSDHPEVLKERPCADLAPAVAALAFRSRSFAQGRAAGRGPAARADAAGHRAAAGPRVRRRVDARRLGRPRARRSHRGRRPGGRRRRRRRDGRRPAGHDADARAGRGALARPAAPVQRDRLERPGAARRPRRCASRARRITCARR